MGIGIDEYREFIALAECLNFTKAAERLYITQPALSKHVAAIEKEFGARLFDRDRRSVKLTEYGEIVLAGARKIVDAYDETVTHLVEQAKRRPIRVDGVVYDQTVSAILAIASRDLVHIGYPPIQLGQGVNRSIADMLRDGEIDVAFSYTASSQMEEEHFARIPMTVSQFIAVVDIDSPFAGQPSVSMDDLRDETFVHFTDAYAQSGWARIERACLHHGYEPKQRMVEASPSSYAMTMPDGGILIQPRNLKQLKFLEDSGSVALVPVSDEDARFVIDCIYRIEDKERLSDFLAAVTSACNQLIGRDRRAD